MAERRAASGELPGKNPGRRSPPRLLRPLVLGLLGLVGTAGALIVHRQAPAARSALQYWVQRALPSSIGGSLHIGPIPSISPFGAHIESIRLLDSGGAELLNVEGVSLRFDPWNLLSTLALGRPGSVALRHLVIERAHVDLRSTGPGGSLAIAQALRPTPTEAAADSAPGANQAEGSRDSRDATVALQIDAFEVGSVRLRYPGAPGGGAAQGHIRRLVGRGRLDGDRSELVVERFGARISAPALGSARGTGSLAIDGSRRFEASWHGFVRGIESDIKLVVEGGARQPLRATIRLPRVDPRLAARWLEDWPLQVPLSVDLTLEGDAARMAIAVEARAAGSRVSLQGELEHLWPTRGTLALKGTGLDARLFSAGAPATNAQLAGTLALDLGARTQLSARGRIAPTQVGARPVPELAFEASYAEQAFEMSLRGQQAGGRAELELTAAPSKPIRARLTAHGVQLGRIAELQGTVAGRANLTASAELQGTHYAATGQLEVATVRSGSWAVGELSLGGSISGDAGAESMAAALPHLDAHLKLSRMATADVAFDQIAARLEGPLDRLRVNVEGRDRALGKLNAQGLVDAAGGLKVREAELQLGTPQTSLRAQLAVWDAPAGALHLPLVQLESTHGGLSGSLHWSPNSLAIGASSKGLDPRGLARELGLGWPWPSGTVSGDVELTMARPATRGSVDLSVDKPSFRGYEMESGRLVARLQDERFQGHVAITGDTLGRARVDVLGTRPGLATSRDAWVASEFEAELNTDLSLWPIGLALRGAPLRGLQGDVHARLRMQRPAQQALPDLFIEAEGRSLAGTLAFGSLHESLEGFGLKLVALLPASQSRARAQLFVEDGHGPLLTGQGELGTDLGALLAIFSEPPGRASLATLPVAATAQLVHRPLAHLPLKTGLGPLEGHGQARAHLSGTLGRPRLRLDAALVGFRAGLGLASTPLDASLGGQLDIESLRFQARTEVGSRGHGVLTARADGQLAQGSRPLLLTAGAMLDGVALSALPVLADAGLSGSVFGSLQLELTEPGLFRQAASLRFEGLSVRDQPLGSGPLTVLADNSRATADLSLRHQQGQFLFEGQLKASQPAGLQALPFYDSGRARVVGQQLPLEVLNPVLRGVVSPTSGHLNSDLSIRATREPDQRWRWAVDGTAQVAQATAHIENLGLELQDINISALARSNSGSIQVLGTELTARANQRQPSLQGGFELTLDEQTLRLQVGEADLQLDALPLRLQGASWGHATGEARVTLSEGQDFTAVRLLLPDLRVELPRQPQVDLIDLESHPDVRVLQYAPKAGSPGEAPHLWKVVVDLGRGVRLSRGGLDLPIGGQLVLDMGRSVQASGAIEAKPGGRFDLYGRNFQIEQGSVRLTADEPDNPLINVVASWSAPDGTRVSVELTGSAKDPQIVTRDDAGLSEAERFRLITGNALPRGAGADGEASAASLVGPAFAALQLNQYLYDNLGDVSLSVGAGSDASATYTASVRLSDRLWFEGNYKPEGGRSDWLDTLVGVLDYHFSSKWSLRTKLGRSAGSAFDLLWSHRY